MADTGQEKKEAKITSHIGKDSVKVIAESIGFSGLSDDASQVIADDITYRMKQIVQDAQKFMMHGKRKKLTTADFEQAMRAKNIEPLYGFYAPEYIPFRHASGGGRECHFIEEKELELDDIINATLPKIPLEVNIKTHWLAIDGDQPSIPENPAPVSKDTQKEEMLNPAIKSLINKPKPKPLTEPGKSKQKLKATEKVKLKELATHELSVEQQLYYKEITEACVGSDETRRTEALSSLQQDPGLHQMLPRFSTFIYEGVKVNVVQNNLALLIYLMRMVKSLMDNQSLYLEKYLHELIPAIGTCVVSKQLCLRPDVDNHWALRDFAAKLMSQLCRAFSSNTNNIQARVTKLFGEVLANEKGPLATHYGAISGLGELGTEVSKTLVIPYVKVEGDRIQQILEGPIMSNIERIAAEHVKSHMIRVAAQCLRAISTLPDNADDYKNQYGYLGVSIHAAVVKARLQPTAATAASTISAVSSCSVTAAQPFGALGARPVQSDECFGLEAMTGLGTRPPQLLFQTSTGGSTTPISRTLGTPFAPRPAVITTNQFNNPRLLGPGSAGISHQPSQPHTPSAISLTPRISVTTPALGGHTTTITSLTHRQPTATTPLITGSTTPGGSTGGIGGGPGGKFVVIQGGQSQQQQQQQSGPPTPTFVKVSSGGSNVQQPQKPMLVMPVTSQSQPGTPQAGDMGVRSVFDASGS